VAQRGGEPQVAVAAAGVGYWVVLRTPARGPVRPSPASAGAKPIPRVEPAETGSLEVTTDAQAARVFVDGRSVGVAPQRVDGLAAGGHPVRVEKEGLTAYQLEAHVIPGQVTRVRARLVAPIPARSLRVTSDVQGASVFLDRRFLGKTPVEIEGVEPGPHRLNVSVEGYEMHAETLEVGEGAREVVVRFKEIKLDESVAVAHKHGLGSCQGRLVAAVQGLRYETAKADDAFSVPLEGIEELSVDYLKSSLRLRLRGGRSYNFSGQSADALLGFQKKVEAARQRLAAG